MEYDFTAHLEEQLDDISSGKINWITVLDHFWTPFYQAISQAKELNITDVINHLDHDLERFIYPTPEDGKDVRKCPQCAEGHLSLRLGKWGAFVGCNLYPDCSYTRRVLTNSGDESQEGALGGESFETRILGIDPVTQKEVYLKKGPYGFYLEWQMTEALPIAPDEEPKITKNKEAAKPKKPKKKAAIAKPKRVSLPKGALPFEVTLEQALSLGALPRFVGNHPDTGSPIMASLGRFGPYIKYEDRFKSIGKNDDLLTINLDRALELLAQVVEKKTTPFPV